MWPNTLNSVKGFGVQNAVLCYAGRCKRAAISVYTCMRKRGSRLLKARVVSSWYSILFLWLYCWGGLCLSKVLCMPSPCVHCGLQCIENYTCSSPLAIIPFRIRNDCNCFLRASPISPEHLVFKLSNSLLPVFMLCFHLFIIFADCEPRENWRNIYYL